ncbi:PhoH family protein [Chondrinema litorale]|uniref:PhoH family protein n=1 Tax=Chondrinema litorale TaxID=2994555 RepID=UPI002543C466|nr:PhoH family protein [Chondrinema litorale]UZR93660.1 PhoH family protein [Chondrinema litorale]
MAGRRKKQPKIFVLDTSVILYDHASINNFEENDVAIPISVLEELDNFKKGNDTLNFNAREFTRFLDNASDRETLHEWIPIQKGNGKGKMKVIMDEESQPDAREIFGANKADHRILNVAIKLKQEFPSRSVTLISKDINLRIKAKSLDLIAADYETGKVTHVDELYSGMELIDGVDNEIIDKIYKDGSCSLEELNIDVTVVANKYFIIKNNSASALTYYNPETKLLERVHKTNAYNIKPKNAEQVFALHALLNNNIRLVTLQGVAGTGKTLLALAGAIEMRKSYQQIYLARPIVPLSNKDIGFLPGDIKSKLNPYMEPLYDNLKFIKNQFKETDKEFKRITEMLDNEKLVITPLAYIRGRSLSNIFFIVDEAQNLTPHEIKTIITRAGENTKIIFTGDIYQIDTPYLDTQSNGLSYLIDRLHNHPLVAHVKLQKGERSELANLANDLL